MSDKPDLGAPNVPGCTCDRDDDSDPGGPLVMCDKHEDALRPLRWETLAMIVIDLEAALTAGLDVERLARAMAVVFPVSFRGEFASDNPSRRLLTGYAAKIAREYAALAPKGPAEATA